MSDFCCMSFFSISSLFIISSKSFLILSRYFSASSIVGPYFFFIVLIYSNRSVKLSKSFCEYVIEDKYLLTQEVISSISIRELESLSVNSVKDGSNMLAFCKFDRACDDEFDINAL